MLMNITKYLHTIIQLYNYKLGIIIKDVTDNYHMNAFLFNTLRTLLIANENCVVKASLEYYRVFQFWQSNN
jgi:hypothetical protein